MPCYPKEGFLDFWGDVLVVKLGQVEDMAFDFYKIPD